MCSVHAAKLFLVRRVRTTSPYLFGERLQTTAKTVVPLESWLLKLGSVCEILKPLQGCAKLCNPVQDPGRGVVYPNTAAG